MKSLAASAIVFLMTASLVAQTQPAPATRPTDIPKDWVLTTAGTAFTFWSPPDLKEEKTRGIDSFVGKYSNPKMAVSFDYGAYSDPMKDSRYTREAIKLDGHDAFLIRWNGGVGIYVPQVNDSAAGPDKLSMRIICDSAVADQAITLLRGIKFIAPATKPK